jgi:hypothetical protein
VRTPLPAFLERSQLLETTDDRTTVPTVSCAAAVVGQPPQPRLGREGEAGSGECGRATKRVNALGGSHGRCLRRTRWIPGVCVILHSLWAGAEGETSRLAAAPGRCVDVCADLWHGQD